MSKASAVGCQEEGVLSLAHIKLVWIVSPCKALGRQIKAVSRSKVRIGCKIVAVKGIVGEALPLRFIGNKKCIFASAPGIAKPKSHCLART